MLCTLKLDILLGRVEQVEEGESRTAGAHPGAREANQNRQIRIQTGQVSTIFFRFNMPSPCHN